MKYRVHFIVPEEIDRTREIEIDSPYGLEHLTDGSIGFPAQNGYSHLFAPTVWKHVEEIKP